jgi:hypothetical protein
MSRCPRPRRRRRVHQTAQNEERPRQRPPSLNRIMGQAGERMPTSVPERRRSDWNQRYDRRTARMLKPQRHLATARARAGRRQSQSSRMALPACGVPPQL